MRGVKAKRLRNQARKQCDARITHRMTRIIKVKEQLMLGPDKKPVIGPDGKPIVMVPEHSRCTEWWPIDSYRRVLKMLKRGRETGTNWY